MNRRTFLRRSAVVGLAGTAAPALFSRTSKVTAEAKASRIGISTWRFHNLFTATHDKEAAPISGAPLDARNFPDMIADHYHVHELEIVAPHIATEASYIRDL